MLGRTRPQENQMTTMFVRHNVSDFTNWKKGYDAFDAKRKALGVTAQASYQSVTDPKDVTVTHTFSSLEAAKTFAASPELKEAMKTAGVIGEPSIWYANQN
jgi:hypothetical protein